MKYLIATTIVLLAVTGAHASERGSHSVTTRSEHSSSFRPDLARDCNASTGNWVNAATQNCRIDASGGNDWVQTKTEEVKCDPKATKS